MSVTHRTITLEPEATPEDYDNIEKNEIIRRIMKYRHKELLYAITWKSYQRALSFFLKKKKIQRKEKRSSPRAMKEKAECGFQRFHKGTIQLQALMRWKKP